MKKERKKLSSAKRKKRMLNAVGCYALWRDMNCPVRILGVTDSVDISTGAVKYQGLKEIIGKHNMIPVLQTKKAAKQQNLYIVELPQEIEIDLSNGEKQKTKILFLPRADLSSPISQEIVETIAEAAKTIKDIVPPRPTENAGT